MRSGKAASVRAESRRSAVREVNHSHIACFQGFQNAGKHGKFVLNLGIASHDEGKTTVIDDLRAVHVLKVDPVNLLEETPAFQLGQNFIKVFHGCVIAAGSGQALADEQSARIKIYNRYQKIRLSLRRLTENFAVVVHGPLLVAEDQIGQGLALHHRDGDPVRQGTLQRDLFDIRQLGKDPATISKWCTNRAQPGLETLVEIAEVLDVEVGELLRNNKE